MWPRRMRWNGSAGGSGSTSRTVPHPLGPSSSRDRPLLLGAIDQEQPAHRRLPRAVRRRPAGLRPGADDWFPLTYVLDNLNRGMGLPDGYPFVLSPPAVEKLKFVHETLNAGTTSGGSPYSDSSPSLRGRRKLNGTSRSADRLPRYRPVSP